MARRLLGAQRSAGGGYQQQRRLVSGGGAAVSSGGGARRAAGHHRGGGRRGFPAGTRAQAARMDGGLAKQSALWLARGVIALPAELVPSPDNCTVTLHASHNAALAATPHGVQGADLTVALVPLQGGIPEGVASKFPHVNDHVAFTPQAVEAVDFNLLLTMQLAVDAVVHGAEATVATGVQTAGVLDDVFAYDGPLGIAFPDEGSVSLTLWAPTAREITARILSGPPDVDGTETVAAVPLARSEQQGTWGASVPRDTCYGKFLQYDITVFVPWTNHVERVTTTDPYAHSLSANGLSAHVVDVATDPETGADDAWRNVEARMCEAPTDMAIYELHVRDFSASDPCVPDNVRGTFAAFALPPAPSPDDAPHEASAACSQGVRHLAQLAESGMTHVHLLPVYDFGSVDERRERWQDLGHVDDVPPDSDHPQARMSEIKDADGFNWGYDPVHYLAPDGSYATDPDGAARVREMRGLTAALTKLNLGVIMDVVFNHTFAAGCTAHTSILDKVVPGYYYRRRLDGEIEHSTCMNNTASEHYMCERLVVDAVVHWARTYKITGFRFDLMGHMMLSTMLKIRAALDRLTADEDGIDGAGVYLYGEGWDFGEVANNARGVNAAQRNLFGSGIGSFNDRIREAVVGGSPFGDPRVQGFATGLGTDPNAYTVATTPQDEQRRVLVENAERLMTGITGNLRDAVFLKAECRASDASEAFTMGKDAGWLDSYCGYTATPTENVNYVSAHDNETLFDQLVWKLPVRGAEADAPSGVPPPEEYARRSIFCSACVAYAQGVPFYHAGDDILRSKSLDRDSYNSGDHFNRLRWDMKANNFGVGLPPAEKNQDKFELMRPLLAARAWLAPDPYLIRRTNAAFRELLRVRQSSPLFRLRTAEEVQARLFFDAPQADGVVVYAIVDGGERGVATELRELDPSYAMVIVVLNARADTYVHRCGVAGAEMEAPRSTAAELGSEKDAGAKASGDDGGFELRLPPRRLARLLDSWKRSGRKLHVHQELQGSVDETTREIRVLPVRGGGEVGFALSVPPATAAVFVAPRE